MVQEPDIAVIIPAFNAAGYIDQALATLAGQTYPPAVVAIADDCSTDDTVKRALRWQSLLSIKVIQLERTHGPGQARHRAILSTTTPLLAILDADDLLFPDHLATLRTAYERSPGLVTALDFAWIPDRGVGLDTAARRARLKPVPQGPTEQLVWILQANTIANPLFSRAAYDQAGGFREEFFWGEDWDLWIRMVRAGVTVTGTSHPTGLRRLRHDAMTADPASNAELALAVLTKAVEEAQSPVERKAAERGRRTLLARKRYYEARALARAGHPWRARIEAARSLGPAEPKVALGLGSMVAAPRISMKLEQAIRRSQTFSLNEDPAPNLHTG